MHDDELERLLCNSRAVDAFKQAAQKFATGGDSKLINYPQRAPRIKVLRTLMKLLESYPQDEITDVRIDAASTCSSFHGELTFGPSGHKIRFNWDCRWKAEEAGFVTWFGAVDQSRAAEEFGYQCFRQFEKVN
jgi:hypothetical protein